MTILVYSSYESVISACMCITSDHHSVYISEVELKLHTHHWKPILNCN